MLTEQQKLERRTYIGGSDVGAICGLNPYRTPLDVYREKVEGIVSDLAQNSFIDWGNFLEAPLRAKFTEITGLSVQDAAGTKYGNPEFLAANVDGVSSDNNILEIKCVGLNARKNWDENMMPSSYLAQCAHYAYIYDVECVHLAAFFGIDRPLTIYKYERHDAFELRIRQRCIEFWKNHVIPQIPPDPTTYNEIKELIGDSRDGITKVAPDEIGSLAYEIAKNNIKIKALQQKNLEHQTKLIKFMEDAEVLYDIDGTKLCTFKTYETKRLDSKRLRELHPEIAMECSKSSKIRRFNALTLSENQGEK